MPYTLRVERRLLGPWRRGHVLWAYAFVAPALLLLALFALVPIATAIAASFKAFVLPNSFATSPWIGLRNYQALWSDPEAWYALRATLLYAAGSAALGLSAAIGLALLLQERLPGSSVARVLLFVPVVAGEVVTATVFSFMFDEQLGLFNWISTSLGGPRVPWLRDPVLATAMVIGFGAWGGAAYNTPFFVSAVRAVPRELYEAAAIDGAGAWARFQYITVPGIVPILVYTTTMAIIGSFQVIVPMAVLTNGGPVIATPEGTISVTQVVIQYIYRTAIQENRVGYASAFSVIVLAILMVLTWAQLRFARARYGAG